MRLPHSVGLRQPLRVKKSLANDRHGSHQRGWVTARVGSFIAHMCEGNILPCVGDKLLHFFVIVGQQHNSALAPKNPRVGIH